MCNTGEHGKILCFARVLSTFTMYTDVYMGGGLMSEWSASSDPRSQSSQGSA